MKNKISVVILTFNAQKFVEETIKSVLQQTYGIYELIILDDHSTDDTLEIISRYKIYPNVYVISNNKNLGIARNINRAVSKVKGDWVLFLGHDDLLPEKHLEKMSKYLEEVVAFVHCNAMLIDENGKEIGWARDNKSQIEKTSNPLRCFITSNFISSCGLVMNKKIFKSVQGWDEKFKNYGEWLLWIKMATSGKIVYVTNTYGKYRKHESSTISEMKKISNRKNLELYKQFCRTEAYLRGDKDWRCWLIWKYQTIKNYLLVWIIEFINKMV